MADRATIEATIRQGRVVLVGVDVFTFDGAGRIASVRAYWERPRLEPNDH